MKTVFQLIAFLFLFGMMGFFAFRLNNKTEIRRSLNDSLYKAKADYDDSVWNRKNLAYSDSLGNRAINRVDHFLQAVLLMGHRDSFYIASQTEKALYYETGRESHRRKANRLFDSTRLYIRLFDSAVAEAKP